MEMEGVLDLSDAISVVTCIAKLQSGYCSLASSTVHVSVFQKIDKRSIKISTWCMKEGRE